MSVETVKSRYMRMGDRIIVEPDEGPDFQATVVACLGWGLVHGVMDWLIRRDDGTEFTYGIHIDTPVLILTTATDSTCDRCGEPSPDSILCDGCADREDDLDAEIQQTRRPA